MEDIMKILGLVPARGRSKKLPRKNIRLLMSRPLIFYTIDAALKSKYSIRTIVSTDDEGIAEISRQARAEVPFIRPSHLAQDDTPMLPVLQHAIEYFKKEEDYYPDIVVLLQPTSPLRTAEHIDQAIELLLKTGADSVVSLCETEHSLYWMKKVDEEGRVTPFIEGAEEYTRRQDLPRVCRLNGAIFVTRPDIVMKEGRVLGNDTRAYIMDQEDSIDIDTELDFKLAELLIKERGGIIRR